HKGISEAEIDAVNHDAASEIVELLDGGDGFDYAARFAAAIGGGELPAQQAALRRHAADGALKRLDNGFILRVQNCLGRFRSVHYAGDDAGDVRAVSEFVGQGRVAGGREILVIERRRQKEIRVLVEVF